MIRYHPASPAHISLCACHVFPRISCHSYALANRSHCYSSSVFGRVYLSHSWPLGQIHRPSRYLPGFFGYLSLCIQLILTRRHSAIIHHLFLLFIFHTYIAYNRYEYTVSIVHAVNNLTGVTKSPGLIFWFVGLPRGAGSLASNFDRSSVLTGRAFPPLAVGSNPFACFAQRLARRRFDRRVSYPHLFSSRTPL